jgi:hypothetical protein
MVAHAAHAEGRAGAEATRRNLQVLRIVLTVLRDQSRHDGQRFGRIDVGLPAVERFGIDHVDRSGQIEAGVFAAGAADDDDARRRCRIGGYVERGQAKNEGGGEARQARLVKHGFSVVRAGREWLRHVSS